MNQKNQIAFICSKCQQQNYFNFHDILEFDENILCSSCQKKAFRYAQKSFDGLKAENFIHPLDHKMLSALKKVPGTDSVLKFFLKESFEMSMRLYHHGNFLKVSDKQSGKLYKQLLKACKILDLAFVPELYIAPDPKANAYTFGVNSCAITITSGALDLLSDDEVLSILAHEVGHIKAGHVLYKTASRILASVADSIAQKTLGLGNIILYPIQMALLKWDRASELSSDRASLLVVKKPQVVISTLMKLSSGSKKIEKNLDIKEFIAQAQSYEKTKEEGFLGKYFSIIQSIFLSHPFPIWRAQELLSFINSGAYFDILNGDFKDHLEKYNSQSKEKTKNNSDTLNQAIDNLKNWYDKNFS